MTGLGTAPDDVLRLIGDALTDELPALSMLSRSTRRLHCLLARAMAESEQSAVSLLKARLGELLHPPPSARFPECPLHSAPVLDCAWLRLTPLECALIARFLSRHTIGTPSLREGTPCAHCTPKRTGTPAPGLDTLRVAALRIPVRKLLLGAVAHLDLQHEQVAREDIAVLSVLLSSGGGSRLRSFGLQGAEYGDEVVRRLALPLHAGALSQLSLLWLSHLCLTDCGVGALARALEAGTPVLHHLTLSDNHISSCGLDALGRCFSEGLRRLRELSLSGNQLTRLDGLATALSRGGSLEWLELQHNGIDDAGVGPLASLLRSGEPRGLAVLVLEANTIGDEGACGLLDALLLGATPPPALELLDLSSNRLGDATALHLTAQLSREGSPQPSSRHTAADGMGKCGTSSGLGARGADGPAVCIELGSNAISDDVRAALQSAADGDAMGASGLLVEACATRSCCDARAPRFQILV